MGSADLYLYSGLLLAGFSVYQFLSAILTNNTDKQILSWASGNEPVKSKSPIINFSRPLVHQFTIQHALKIKNENYRKKIEKLLLTAGMRRELNVDEYIGLQILWGLMFPVLLIILNFSLSLGFDFLILIGFGLAGFMFPEIHCRGSKKKRELEAKKDLPFFADLLALSTEAGLDLTGAIGKIVEKSPNSVLGQEFAIVLGDIKLNATREEALRAMADRLDMPEITSFVAVVVDALTNGASIRHVLSDQSEQMRLERFVRAEKAGARASQAILIPMMLFIMPAVFVIVFGPAVIQFMTGGN